MVTPPSPGRSSRRETGGWPGREESGRLETPRPRVGIRQVVLGQIHSPNSSVSRQRGRKREGSLLLAEIPAARIPNTYYNLSACRLQTPAEARGDKCPLPNGEGACFNRATLKSESAMPPFPLEIPDLAAALRTLIAQVPAGKATTCGGLAEALGNPVAARWIGHFLLHHQHDAACLCHRVVRAGGRLGPYIDGGPAAKQPPTGSGRRRGSRRRRRSCPMRLRPLRLGSPPGTSAADSGGDGRRGCPAGAGDDAAAGRRRRRLLPQGTVRTSADEGVAAYALVEVETGQLLWSGKSAARSAFPTSRPI